MMVTMARMYLTVPVTMAVDTIHPNDLHGSHRWNLCCCYQAMTSGKNLRDVMTHAANHFVSHQNLICASRLDCSRGLSGSLVFW
jgi:hypothetical protein